MEKKRKTGLEAVAPGSVQNGKDGDRACGAAAAGPLGRVVLLFPPAVQNSSTGRVVRASCRQGGSTRAERYRRRLDACKYAVLLPWIPLVIYARCYGRPGELQSLHLPGMDSPLMLSYMVCMAALLVAVYLQLKSEQVA